MRAIDRALAEKLSADPEFGKRIRAIVWKCPGTRRMTVGEESSGWANVGEARAEYHSLHSAWWSEYCERGPSRSETKIAEAKAKLELLEAKILEQFGKKNPEHPDCPSCFRASVFGGPRHESSKFCRSGKHPHCSCDTCF